MLIVVQTINIHVPYMYEARPQKLDTSMLDVWYMFANY